MKYSKAQTIVTILRKHCLLLIVDTNVVIIIDRILQDLCHNLSFCITSISPKFICGTVDQSKDNQIVFLADGCIYIFSSTFSFEGIPSLAGQCMKRVTK